MKFLGLLLAASAVLFGQTYHNQDGNYAIKIGDDWKMQEEKESVAIFTKGSSLLTTMAMDLEKEPKLQEALQEEMRYIATGQLSTEETENYILQQLRLPMENAEIVAVNLDFSKAAEGVLKFSYLMEIDNNRVSVEQVQVVNNNRFMVFAATGECENADENAETLEVVLESVLETEEVVADVAEETEEVIADVEETEEVVADVAEEAEEVVADVVEEAEEVVADVVEETEEVAADVAEEAEEAEEVAADVAEEAEEVAADVAEEVEEVVADVVEEAEEVVADVAEEAEEVVADVAEEAEEVVADVEETEEVVADVEDEADDASNEE